MINRWTRVRMVFCGLLLAVLALKVARAAYDLQIRQADEMRGKAEDQYLQQIETRPQRGRILDRNGNELASTAQFDSVFCNPRQLLAIPGGVERLARTLSLDGGALRRALTGKRFFAYVKRTVTAEESAAVAQLGLAGVGFRREPKRVYPGDRLGATVIGHANIDGVGVEGVELAFDKHLRGSSSKRQGIVDGRGRELLLDGLGDRTANAGSDLVLTLDKYLMYVTEKALATAVATWKAKAAVAVMMDPQTGEVLAMASAPTYDPNDLRTMKDVEPRNRAITDSYEPGSIMKTFTFAAVLDRGAVKASDMVDGQLGSMQIGKYRIRDDHPVGLVTAAEVFQKSSNIGTIKIAKRIGREALYESLLRYGFGRPTGIGLPGEVRGRIRPVKQWGDIGFATAAFGHGLTVTPLQITAGVAAIAAGGLYRQPVIALKVVRPDGTVEALARPAPERPAQRIMSEKAAATLLGFMHMVTEKGGTATRAAIDGYPVAGKTGTAQVVGASGRYDPDKWLSSFVGVAPADNPRFVLAVMIKEPQPDHRGGMVAAPVWKEIAEAALKYLRVPPSLPLVGDQGKGVGGKGKDKGADKSADGAALAEGPGGDLPAWEGPDDSAGPPVVLGEDEPAAPPGPPAAALDEEDANGELAEGATPQAAEGPPSSEDAVAEPEEAGPALVALPSFVGMSLGQAIRAARHAGIEISPEGSGIAVAQSPAPGPVARGALCRVSFRPGG